MTSYKCARMLIIKREQVAIYYLENRYIAPSLLLAVILTGSNFYKCRNDPQEIIIRMIFTIDQAEPPINS